MIAVPKKVAERFTKQTGKFQRILKNAKKSDVSEADTVTIVKDMLEGVFGFDKYADVTGEFPIKGTRCDLAIKLHDHVSFLIEVKAIGKELKQSHIRQATNYGANDGVPWIILTNGIDWIIYEITLNQKVETNKIYSFNFSELKPRNKDAQEKLFLISKEGIEKSAIQAFDKHAQVVNKYVIGAMLSTEPVLSLIRRNLRKVSPGLNVDKDEIKGILERDVIKGAILEDDDANRAKKMAKKASA